MTIELRNSDPTSSTLTFQDFIYMILEKHGENVNQGLSQAVGGVMPTRDRDNRSLWNDRPAAYLDFSGSGYINL